MLVSEMIELLAEFPMDAEVCLSGVDEGEPEELWYSEEYNTVFVETSCAFPDVPDDIPGSDDDEEALMMPDRL